jgi:hypothetical protein
MPTSRPLTLTLLIGALGALVGPAAAQCTIDFEDLAVGTAVTTQYDGVTFSVLPQSCDNHPTLYMRIVQPAEGTSSGTKAIKIDGGCPDFSIDYLRMVFDVAHDEISFTLGDFSSTYTIRYYSTTSGASGLIGSFDVDIPGAGEVGVHREVTVASATKNIRRIEVEDKNDFFEAIDDLTFYQDETPPTVDISEPTYETCDCDNSITFRGLSCEPDGEFDHDELHYAPIGSETWTQVGTATTPQCTPNGLLYLWNTTAIADGLYYVRLTSYNKCGLSSEAVTVVIIDRDFNDPVIRQPTAGKIIGGTATIDGSVYDSVAYGCFDHYTVHYKPVVGGAYQPVDPAHAEYATQVITDPLATWNTAGVADGNYRLRVQALDQAGRVNEKTVDVVVDNTLPTAVLTAPTACAWLNDTVTVTGTANDAHLDSWVLQYVDGATHAWTTIASGNTAVVNGTLAKWNISGLPPCAYTLRLVVYDKTVYNDAHTRYSEYATAFNIGAFGDINGDGELDGFDIEPFFDLLEGK